MGLVERHGAANWTQIAASMGGRCDQRCSRNPPAVGGAVVGGWDRCRGP